jgi:hypothetical protein
MNATIGGKDIHIKENDIARYEAVIGEPFTEYEAGVLLDCLYHERTESVLRGMSSREAEEALSEQIGCAVRRHEIRQKLDQELVTEYEAFYGPVRDIGFGTLLREVCGTDILEDALEKHSETELAKGMEQRMKCYIAIA